MTLLEYREKMWQYAVYPNKGDNLLYAELGLISEIGELAGEAKRIIRDDNGELTPERREKIIDELGDILWYIAACSHEGNDKKLFFVPKRYKSYKCRNVQHVAELVFILLEDVRERFYPNSIKVVEGICEWLETDISTVLQKNLEKLESRRQRDKLKGSGGDR